MWVCKMTYDMLCHIKLRSRKRSFPSCKRLTPFFFSGPSLGPTAGPDVLLLIRAAAFTGSVKAGPLAKLLFSWKRLFLFGSVDPQLNVYSNRSTRGRRCVPHLNVNRQDIISGEVWAVRMSVLKLRSSCRAAPCTETAKNETLGFSINYTPKFPQNIQT